MSVGPRSDRLSRDSDEQVVLALARDGDRRAFKLIYERYSKTVFTYLVYATPHVQDAEDLTQEVFLSVWRKLYQFRSESRFSTWVMAIAVTTAKMWGRRRRPNLIPFDESVGLSVQPGAFCTADLLDLRNAICRLPARARTVLVLHELTNHNHEEIAAIMGITAGASKAQLSRAKRLLRERIVNERQID